MTNTRIWNDPSALHLLCPLGNLINVAQQFQQLGCSGAGDWVVTETVHYDLCDFLVGLFWHPTDASQHVSRRFWQPYFVEPLALSYILSQICPGALNSCALTQEESRIRSRRICPGALNSCALTQGEKSNPE
jgi:hypothetical protein